MRDPDLGRVRSLGRKKRAVLPAEQILPDVTVAKRELDPTERQCRAYRPRNWGIARVARNLENIADLERVARFDYQAGRQRNNLGLAAYLDNLIIDIDLGRNSSSAASIHHRDRRSNDERIVEREPDAGAKRRRRGGGA